MAKSPNAFRTISEVASWLGTQSHVLRFWESKFSKIRPTILNGKRRFYSNKDTELFFLIKFLLKDQKLTIDGAKNIINKNIYNLDDFKSSSIKALYFKSKIETKTKNLLKKIKTLKNYGKKNSH